MEKIYLDYAATTPVDGRVIEKINTVQGEQIGNTSSVHLFGREAARILDQAREDVAVFLNAQFNEIIFTSGATESNNIAILGVLSKFFTAHPEMKPHIITSTIEHSSVKEVFVEIEKRGLADVTWVTVNEYGVVDHNEVKSAITPDTILISIQYVNNEVGTIQPIRKIGKIVKKVNEQREREIKNRKSGGEKGISFSEYDKVYFHTDAVQAANYLELDVLKLHVDLLTISGHKIYGPKGVGVLFVKEGIPIESIQFGGEQELSIRPGTHNLAGIAGLAEACKIVLENRDDEVKRIIELRDYLIKGLSSIDGIVINGSMDERICSNINISVSEKSGETLLLLLDREGVAVSTGSACASGSVEPSHVLLAMGLNEERINSAIRITLGRDTSKSESDRFLEVFKKILK